MKWMIASDLHGSARCCREMLEALRREGADRLVLLGDLLYHGPRNDFPEEYDTRAVTALLNGVKDQLRPQLRPRQSAAPGGRGLPTLRPHPPAGVPGQRRLHLPEPGLPVSAQGGHAPQLYDSGRRRVHLA